MAVELPVRRIDFGYFVRPAEETETGQPRVEPCLGYVIAHPDAVVVVDTGMGSHLEVDAHYRPRRRPLADAKHIAIWAIHGDGSCLLRPSPHPPANRLDSRRSNDGGLPRSDNASPPRRS